jgi:DNA-binding response OmpR family regulator
MMQDETVLELAPVASAEAYRQRILVIDDDRDQVEALAFALRRQGFDVTTAHSLAAGRSAVNTIHPQLVIADLGLPDGDGLELCQQLADHEETCEIPVIALSGTERADIVRQARLAGCHFFLRKPYDPNALLLLAQNAIAHGPAW